MRLLVTSDTHLSDKIWKHRPIEGDSYHSWWQIINLTADLDCDAIVIAGDILDKQNNLSRAIEELMAGLRELDRREIEVYYNQGQHEYQSVPWLSLDKKVTWLNDYTVQCGQLDMTGSDFLNNEGLQEYLKSSEVSEVEILVCHQVWLEFMGELCKPQGSFADIPDNVKYLITGDYHEHIYHKYGNLTVLSPGSTHLRSISEPEDKYVFTMDIPDEGGKVKIQSIPLYTRRKISIDTRSILEFKDFMDAIEVHLALSAEYAEDHSFEDNLKTPLMWLTFPQGDVDLCNKIMKLVAGRAHMFYKPVKQVTKESLEPVLLDHIEASDRVSMFNCLSNYIDVKKKPKTHDLATRLLEAPDPEQALYKWIKDQVTK